MSVAVAHLALARRLSNTRNNDNDRYNRPKSPRLLARLTGLFALFEALTSGFGQVIVPRMLIVFGNAAATSANILAHEALFRLSILAAFLGVACHVVWTYLVYELFKPVNRNLALVAVFFSLVAIALQSFSGTLQAAPLVALQGGPALAAFNAEQLKTLAFVFLSFNARVFDAYLISSDSGVLIGYLIFKIHFYASHSRAIGGTCRFVLAYIYLAAVSLIMSPLPTKSWLALEKYR